jgi:hypothetical protein
VHAGEAWNLFFASDAARGARAFARGAREAIVLVRNPTSARYRPAMMRLLDAGVGTEAA